MAPRGPAAAACPRVAVSASMCVCAWVCALLAAAAPAAAAAAADEPDASAALALAARHGYPAELHRVVTEDGYVLAAVRLRSKGSGRPGPGAAARPPPGPPALLWHGMFGSSDVWMLLGPRAAAGFALVDAGVDVWLGNGRGNVYSRGHVRMRANDSAFWNFSWHEMGVYDLPAVIDYILGQTGQQKLSYVGHSMGATSFFVMGAQRPQYNRKVRAAFMLAPVVYISSGHTDVTERLVNVSSGLLEAAGRLGLLELPGPGFMYWLCASWLRLCDALSPLVIGSTYVTKDATAEVLRHLPAGGSMLQLRHYLQLWRTGEFRPLERRLRRAAQPPPPAEYALRRVTAPLHLFRSDGDWSLSPQDAERLARELPAPPREHRVPLNRFQHNDFVFAPQAARLVFARIAALIVRPPDAPSPPPAPATSSTPPPDAETSPAPIPPQSPTPTPSPTQTPSPAQTPSPTPKPSPTSATQRTRSKNTASPKKYSRNELA